MEGLKCRTASDFLMICLVGLFLTCISINANFDGAGSGTI